MRVVLAHGVFDLLHSGHVVHLLQAKAFGDYLLVSLVADKFVSKGRKLITREQERFFMLNALACVDEVVLCQAPGPEAILQERRPYIYIRNDEYITQAKPEYALVRKLGIRVGFTRTVAPHTTTLIERIRGAEVLPNA